MNKNKYMRSRKITTELLCANCDTMMELHRRVDIKPVPSIDIWCDPNTCQEDYYYNEYKCPTCGDIIKTAEEYPKSIVQVEVGKYE